MNLLMAKLLTVRTCHLEKLARKSNAPHAVTKTAGAFVVELTRREHVTRTKECVHRNVYPDHKKLSQEPTSKI
ncbi:hypothetical protein Bca4012_016763 [Brassica carinata]|uniref:Uncharacterized protein n=1 Tax=Brassica carinata TaxID=52824 RepID=A0A8X8BH31_BRACI|nr:hypothetical protein Bca52824_004852 [Brassica carinata]